MVIYARDGLCGHGTAISARGTSSSGSTPTYGRRPSERRTVGTRSWSDIDKTEGFLTDFEIAELRVCRGLYSKLRSHATMRRRRLLTDTADQEPTGFNPPATTGSTPMQGDAITRTAIFMATKLLMEIAKAQAKNLSTAHIFRGREYGVESFYWVIIYVMYRRALLDDELKKDANGFEELTQEFCTLDYAQSIQKLAIARKERLGHSEGENQCVGVRTLVRCLESYEDPQHRAPTVRFSWNLGMGPRSFLPRPAPLTEAQKAEIASEHSMGVLLAHRLGQEPPTLESVLARLSVNTGPTVQADQLAFLSIASILLLRLGEGEWEAAFHEIEDARSKTAAPTEFMESE
ncbi:hypothetical protein BD413DRAFT_274490 [Trametes elegans]|nr:hypothetical protein BD413DRAFT_309932 [Trametes elegans]KAI0759450.1 hypothetical protein BD413DRAFT_274490 [Trametes elegans]